jgi:hypothetical protein
VDWEGALAFFQGLYALLKDAVSSFGWGGVLVALAFFLVYAATSTRGEKEPK